MSNLQDSAKKIKIAQTQLAKLNTTQKNQILLSIKETLLNNVDLIVAANQKDLKTAKDNGTSDTMLDRLTLDSARVNAIACGIEKVMALPDPIGEVLEGKELPNGLSVVKKRVPLGVIGMIYEARPNVTVDSAVLCLKSSNAVLLRGGKEAINTNTILVELMQKAISDIGYNSNMVEMVRNTDRSTTVEMMKLRGYIDVLIPRGGAGLIQSVVDNATVPVIETGVGNCHIYVDEFANINMACEIVYNAKTSRPSVCNACENMLVHRKIADKFLPMVQAKLDPKVVTLLGCSKTVTILGGNIDKATDKDYATEFLDFKLAVKVVEDINEAIEHIAKFTTFHSEAIITNNIQNANKFVNEVDAAAVYINASTRFTDGEEFGMGAEIGISTQKLHARGPMGLRELTSVKYIVTGNGNVR